MLGCVIIVISILPMAIEVWRARRSAKKERDEVQV